MRKTNTLIIGATALACGIASQLGEKCLIVDKAFSAGGEFADAMMASRIDMEIAYAPETQALLEELKEHNALSAEGYPHILGFAGAFAGRFNKYSCPVLLGTRLINTKKTDDGFVSTLFIPDEGYTQILSERVINTEVQDFMSCKKIFSILLAGGMPQISDAVAQKLLNGCFADEYVLQFDVPRDCSLPMAQNLTDKWLKDNKAMLGGAKVAGIALAFGYRFENKVDVFQNGVRYIPSSAYPNAVSAFEGGETLCL